MGTVGINFGPINSGQGFDVASTVTQILAAQQAVEDPWKTQLSNLQAQDTALSKFGTDLSTLSTALQSLTDFSGIFVSKQGSSSDTDVVALSSASNLAVAGSHTIVVNKLAQTSSQYSDKITNASDTLSGSLSFTINGQSQQLDFSGKTLTQLAASINGASMGVSASVITDTTGSRLSLVSSTSGAAGEITMNALSSLSDDATGNTIAFQVGMHGQDASLTVDGLDTTSASNTVTGLIPGVTFQILSKSDPDNPVQVQITNDNTSIEQAMASFVTAYNAVVDDIKNQEGKDSDGNPEPLYGDPTVARIQNQLTQGLLSGAPSGSIKSLSQFGISVDQLGHLNIDGGTLDNSLNTNFADIQGFFQNANSFGQNFTSTLNGLSGTSTKGAISLALKQNSAQEATLNQNISDQEARIADNKSRLTDELNLANQILQSLPDQVNEIKQLYSAITGFNTGQ